MAETPQTCQHGLSLKVLCPACTFTPAAPTGAMKDDEYRKRWRESFKDPAKPPRTPAQRIANYRRAIRQLQRAYDLMSACSIRLAADLTRSRTECAALRSSLEEARKDSERLRAALEQASQTFQSLASPTRHHVAADMDAATEAQARRDIAEAGRVAVATALGSRVTR